MSSTFKVQRSTLKEKERAAGTGTGSCRKNGGNVGVKKSQVQRGKEGE